LRLLVVSNYYDNHVGGIEAVAGQLARRLVRRGVELTWAAAGPAAKGVPARPLRSLNVLERRLGLPFPICSPVDLALLLTQVRCYDVVHLHECLYLANQAVFAAARVSGTPVVVTQHVAPIPYRSRVARMSMALLARAAAPLVLGGADRCVFVSARVQGVYARFVRFRHPPQVIPNGVDLTLFHPVDEPTRAACRAALAADGRPIALFVGRFVEKKGIPWVRHLAGAFPGVRFLLAGAGPLDPCAWGLPNVAVLGPVEHARLPDLYRAADLLILPSFGEGFPLVVQEAMACGTPALVSEETAAGVAGFAEQAFASPLEPAALERAFATAVGAADPARRAQVASWAAAHWDWERCTDAYLALLREVTAGGAAH